MTREISKNLQCILIRGDIEIWLENKRIENLKRELETLNENRFVEVDGSVINTADLVGIFSAEKMEEKTRRKNGEWRCKYGEWHSRGEKCTCYELKRYE